MAKAKSKLIFLGILLILLICVGCYLYTKRKTAAASSFVYQQTDGNHTADDATPMSMGYQPKQTCSPVQRRS